MRSSHGALKSDTFNFVRYGYLGDVWKVQMQRLTILHHQAGSGVVVLADVFKKFRVRAPAQIEATTPRFGIDLRIINQDLILDGIEFDAGETFDCVKLFRM